MAGHGDGIQLGAVADGGGVTDPEQVGEPEWRPKVMVPAVMGAVNHRAAVLRDSVPALPGREKFTVESLKFLSRRQIRLTAPFHLIPVVGYARRYKPSPARVSKTATNGMTTAVIIKSALEQPWATTLSITLATSPVSAAVPPVVA
jgi:hypothetical protein